MNVVNPLLGVMVGSWQPGYPMFSGDGHDRCLEPGAGRLVGFSSGLENLHRVVRQNLVITGKPCDFFEILVDFARCLRSFRDLFVTFLFLRF